MFLQESSLLGHKVGTNNWFEAQKALILNKPLLKFCYDAWYKRLLEDSKSVPIAAADGVYLEIGSGGSLLKNVIGNVVTSDIVEGVADCVVDAMKLPFPDESISAIFMTHSFHHIPNVELFLYEAQRALKIGGVISMIEVARTPFAKFFFGRFHPEPFNDRSVSWSFNQVDSMNDSNQALSWIVLFRDRRKFEKKYPQLNFQRWGYLPWFSYLMSGGVTRRQILPNKLNYFAQMIDLLLKPFAFMFALHWHLTLRKTCSQTVQD